MAGYKKQFCKYCGKGHITCTVGQVNKIFECTVCDYIRVVKLTNSELRDIKRRKEYEDAKRAAEEGS